MGKNAPLLEQFGNRNIIAKTVEKVSAVFGVNCTRC